MWNKDLIEFLKQLSLKYTDVTLALIGVGNNNLPRMLCAVTYDTFKGEEVDHEYRNYITSRYPESINNDELSLGYTTCVMVTDNIPIDNGASFIKGGVLCE